MLQFFCAFRWLGGSPVVVGRSIRFCSGEYIRQMTDQIAAQNRLWVKLTDYFPEGMKTEEKVVGWRWERVRRARRREAIVQPAKGEITLLLAKWKDGDPSAFEELMPLVYPHLREVAAAYIRRERNPDVLQATALVHELYLRLLNQKKAAWDDRQHFYTFAAKVMRMILIDHARESRRRCGAAAMIASLSATTWRGSISAARNCWT